MKSWMKRLLPGKVDFHVPEEVLGLNLTGEHLKQFENLKSLVKRLCVNPTPDPALLLQITDYWQEVRDRNQFERYFIPVLKEFTYFLRLNLLSNDPNVYYRTILVLDSLIKNSDYVAYSLIGKKRLLQTLSITARRNRLKNNYEMQTAASFALDCIQAWGEAFVPRRHLYPNFILIYRKIREKHHIRFPRPDYDPCRVPIFLGPITRREDEFVRYANDHDPDDPASSLGNEEEWEQDWDSTGSDAMSSLTGGGKEEGEREETKEEPLKVTATSITSKAAAAVKPVASKKKPVESSAVSLISFDDLDLMSSDSSHLAVGHGGHSQHQALFPMPPPPPTPPYGSLPSVSSLSSFQSKSQWLPPQNGQQQGQSQGQTPVLHYQPQPPRPMMQPPMLQPRSKQQAIPAPPPMTATAMTAAMSSMPMMDQQQSAAVGHGLPSYAPTPIPSFRGPQTQQKTVVAGGVGGSGGSVAWIPNHEGYYMPVNISSFDIHHTNTGAGKKQQGGGGGYYPTAVADHVLSHYDHNTSSVSNSSNNPFANDSLYYNTSATNNITIRANARSMVTMRSLGDEIDFLLKDQLQQVNTLPALSSAAAVIEGREEVLLAASPNLPAVIPPASLAMPDGNNTTFGYTNNAAVTERGLQQEEEDDSSNMFGRFEEMALVQPFEQQGQPQKQESEQGTQSVKWQRQMIEQSLLQQRQQRGGGSNANTVGVDHNVDIKFYGPQRVVLRK